MFTPCHPKPISEIDTVMVRILQLRKTRPREVKPQARDRQAGMRKNRMWAQASACCPLAAAPSGTCRFFSLCVVWGEPEDHRLALRCFLLAMTTATSAGGLLSRAGQVVPSDCKKVDSVGAQRILGEQQMSLPQLFPLQTSLKVLSNRKPLNNMNFKH